MFVAVINLLTLVAFSVHGVFGCCLHHHHPQSESESCQSVHDSVKCGDSNGANAVGDHNGVAHGECCHDRHGTAASEKSVGDEPESVPCDGSHDCEEPRCSFVAASQNTFDVLGSISTMVAYVGNQLTVCQFSVSSSSSFLWQFESASSSGGSRIYCALMQSWQI